MVARLSRQYGQYDRALAAARAVPGWYNSNSLIYRTAYYKEEGDLAAIVGDTTGAIMAYTRYPTLRTDPDSGAVAEEVEAVRDALARLMEH